MIQKTKEQLFAEKKATLYGVKSGKSMTKEVDVSGRTVSFVGNTYNFVDSYLDVLIPGAAKKTIADNGVNSKSDAKIQHLADHRLSTEYTIGKFTRLEEGEYEHPELGTLTGILADSWITETTKGNDYLINYKNGIYNQHSIGFMYRDLQMADKESKDQQERRNWEQYYPTLVNPEKADEYGFFFVVKEIELWEISTVARGANSLTSTLGIKSDDPEGSLIELYNRLEILEGAAKSATINKKQFNLQIRQIKQMMSEIVNQKPSKKGTFGPPKKDTFNPDDLRQIIKSEIKNY